MTAPIEAACKLIEGLNTAYIGARGCDVALTTIRVDELETLLAALRDMQPVAEGKAVVVPVEPTDEMQHAYFNEIDKNLDRVESDFGFGRYENHKQGYTAMLTARPK